MENDGRDDPAADEIGGGAVNEKPRRLGMEKKEDDDAGGEPTTTGFDPVAQKAHLWHALEGLDRYPRYLSRWNEPDMDRLEQALQEKLQQVRQQRHAVLDKRRRIQQLVQTMLQQQEDTQRLQRLHKGPNNWQELQQDVLDPAMTKAIFGSRMFRGRQAPSLQDVLSGQVQVELDVAQLQVVMDEALPDVFTLPLLRPEFCALLRDYVKAVAVTAQQQGDDEDNMTSLRPLDLDVLGLQWVNDLLFHLVLRPLSRHLFETTETFGDLDWRQGYIAAYAAKPNAVKPRTQLVTHTDDSEVTLNVGLGEPDFEGGLLEFRGLRGTDVQGQLVGDGDGRFQPVEGTALLHAGRHFHDVTPVTKGDRYALIVWARSWNGVRQQECPCCGLIGGVTARACAELVGTNETLIPILK